MYNSILKLIKVWKLEFRKKALLLWSFAIYKLKFFLRHPVAVDEGDDSICTDDVYRFN